MKQYILNSAFAIALLCILVIGASAQEQLVITMNDNSLETYDLAEIRSVKFGSTTMQLHLNNGDNFIWTISDIANYRFAGAIGLTDDSKLSAGAFEVFPNPASQGSTQFFKWNAKGKITLELLNMMGERVQIFCQGLVGGICNYDWRVNVPVGTYVCILRDEFTIMSKLIIIE